MGSIDNEFDTSSLAIQYQNIDFETSRDLGLLGRFYCELYIKEFPDENERESLDNIIAQAQRIRRDSGCTYHCIIATLKDKIIGGIIGDYFVGSNSGVIEFIVVSSECRKQRVGANLISSLVDFFHADALQYNKKSSIDYCFFEVENYTKLQQENTKENCISRLNFWKKMSARIMEMDYIQPPLEKGKKAVDYLFLAVCVVNHQLSHTEIGRDILLRFISEYFKYAFDIRDIDSCNEYLQIKIAASEQTIAIKSIDEILAI